MTALTELMNLRSTISELEDKYDLLKQAIDDITTMFSELAIKLQDIFNEVD